MGLNMNARIMAILLYLLLAASCAFAQDYGTSESDSTGQAKRSKAISTLLSVQAAAEDIIDFALLEDWPRVQGDAAVIERSWAQYDSQKVTESLYAVMRMTLSSSLSQIKSASQDKNATAVIQAANNLSSAVGNLIADQHPVVPSDLMLLEVLERQLAADGAAQNFQGADRCLDKLKMVWNRTKGSVQDRKGYELAGKFSASLRAQEIAAKVDDGPATSSEANKGLQILSSIRKLYE
jgi:hypothetical protein